MGCPPVQTPHSARTATHEARGGAMDLTLRMVSPWSKVAFGPAAKPEPRVAQPFGRGTALPSEKAIALWGSSFLT